MNFDPDIFDAIEFGDLESVKMYWTDEIDIDFQDSYGITMTMLAAKYQFEEIVKYLLEFNPNIKLKNSEGRTAIDIARDSKDKSIYNLLINYNKRNKY